MTNSKSVTKSQRNESGSLMLSTGLALASLIILPAVATRIGLGPSLTGALRIALMKASSRVGSGSSSGEEACTGGFSCH